MGTASRNGTNTVYRNHDAANISDPFYKKNIARFSEGAVSIILNAPTYRYDLIGNEDTGRKISPMTTDLPDWMPRTDDNGVDLLDDRIMIGVMWEAIRELALMVNKLAGEDIADPAVDALKDRIRERLGKHGTTNKPRLSFERYADEEWTSDHDIPKIRRKMLESDGESVAVKHMFRKQGLRTTQRERWNKQVELERRERLDLTDLPPLD